MSSYTPSTALFVCITCKKREGDRVINENAGEELFDSLCDKAKNFPHLNISINPTKCLSACKKACAVALSAPHKYGYVFAHVNGDDADDILTLAQTYTKKEDGVLKKIDRPDALKDKVQGRIPPLDGFLQSS